MLQSVTRRVTRAIETMLPTTTADAGCPPDSWLEHKTMGGVCFERTCSTNGACKVYCGPWASTNNNNC